jgi:hypothetical protein
MFLGNDDDLRPSGYDAMIDPIGRLPVVVMAALAVLALALGAYGIMVVFEKSGPTENPAYPAVIIGSIGCIMFALYVGSFLVIAR